MDCILCGRDVEDEDLFCEECWVEFYAEMEGLKNTQEIEERRAHNA